MGVGEVAGGVVEEGSVSADEASDERVRGRGNAGRPCLGRGPG